jgi:DNA-binding transcriptional regulator YiaG
MTTIRESIAQLVAAQKAEKRARTKLTKAIKRARKRRHLTLDQVAAVLGCSKTFAFKLERGEPVPEHMLRDLTKLLEPGPWRAPR